MSEAMRTIDVYADWIGLESATRIGTLSVRSPRGRDVFMHPEARSVTFAQALLARSGFVP